MVCSRFADTLHPLHPNRSRRAVVAALANAILGASLAFQDQADARRKSRRRRRKKRKLCRGATKQCGGTCIPATSCCASAECGLHGTCVDATCQCDNGFKACRGACIAEGDRCGACPGATTCVGGACVCPDNAPFTCPGDVCVFGDQCCDTSACPTPQVCSNGTCTCPIVSDINCVDRCCNGAANEVCHADKSNPDELQFQCQPGGCPSTNVCTDFITEVFLCANDADHVCLCTSTADLIPGQVCVDFLSLGDESCQPCDTSSDCGSGRVCVADGPACTCGSNFCASLCPQVARHGPRHGMPADAVALAAQLRRNQRRKHSLAPGAPDSVPLTLAAVPERWTS